MAIKNTLNSYELQDQRHRRQVPVQDFSFVFMKQTVFKHGPQRDRLDQAHALEYFYIVWHLKNSSFVFEVSFPLSLCFVHREVPLCAIYLCCYLHSLFKISMTFLPRDGFQGWTKLFIFTTSLPVLTSSCPATRYSKPKREQSQGLYSIIIF